MEADKKLFDDIKKIVYFLKNLLAYLFKNKIKVLKWLAVILVIFLLYGIYKIIAHRKVEIRPVVIHKSLLIKKSGYYKLGFNAGIKNRYFYKRRVIAKLSFKRGKNRLVSPSLRAILATYRGEILPNANNLREFHKSPYHHLIFRVKIRNFKTDKVPFFLFFVSFNNKDKADKILYTPIHIPNNVVIRNHIVLADVRENGRIKLITSPFVKRPHIFINKFVYFYSQFRKIGNVHNIIASFKYKYKNAYYTTTGIPLYNGELINIYKILKNKKNKGKRLFLTKIIISYKGEKGNLQFISNELVEPDIRSFINRVFKGFIYKRYFKAFMETKIFKRYLKKEIYKNKTKGKKKFINNTLKKIVILDYTTKIKHISKIHNKIVRSFYSFIYRKYRTNRSVKTYYKNILIPINSSAVSLRIISGDFSQNKKEGIVSVNFKKLKLYRYWTRDKYILKRILNAAPPNVKTIIIRGSNSDYWHGKNYYRHYPLLIRLRAFVFNDKSYLTNSYFYYRGLPYSYPDFLMKGAKNSSYDNKLKVINKYTSLGAYNFFKNLNVINKNYKIINIKEKEKEKEKEKKFALVNKKIILPFPLRNYINKIILLKFNSLNIQNISYGLIQLYSNQKIRKLKKFIKLKCYIINYHKTIQISLPTRIININGGNFILMDLSNKKLNNIKEIKLKFMPKKISRLDLYAFKRFHFDVGNEITFINFAKSKKTLLDYVLNTPILEVADNFNSLKSLITLKKIANKNHLDKLFLKGNKWLYKNLYLKQGVYTVNPLNNSILKINSVSVESLNEK